MRDFDFRPDTPIEQGIQQFVAWFREYRHVYLYVGVHGAFIRDNLDSLMGPSDNAIVANDYSQKNLHRIAPFG